MMEGILLVNKPIGWTSFDAVNYVRRIVAYAENKKPKNVKVGHSGTLDPFASGLLILLVGKNYTRRAEEFSKLDKTYSLTLRLGETSTTGDPEGQIAHISGTIPSNMDLYDVVSKYIGQIQQIPPIYSAIKIDGQRAYNLARKGVAVTMKPRTITIHKITVVNYQYPFAHLTASVSSGTYIRTLSEDIGRDLGTGAYTTELQRTHIGSYNLEQAVDTIALDISAIKSHLSTF
jgi:tRNA pseudouridine55 synthase